MNKEVRGYDNNHPRAQQSQLTGFGARAVAAHQNSFESLILFATAALTALATQHTTQTIQALAILYLVTRCIYHVLYLFDYALLRSIIWAIGLIASLSIICLCFP